VHDVECAAYLQHFPITDPSEKSVDRLCVNGRGGTGAGGWVHLNSANGIPMSGHRFRNTMVGTG